MRIYVVVTCYDPLRIYVYREGLARIASDKYTQSDCIENMENKFAHLTNYSINKKNENYHSKEENQEGSQNNFKWSFAVLSQHFRELGLDVNLMWSKIYDVIIKSLMSIEEEQKG